jgi:NAD(P)H-hydrate epimerase
MTGKLLTSRLLSAEAAGALDAEAAAWGLDPFALVEAAGRACAAALVRGFPQVWEKPSRVLVMAGSGNNGADALVMLRALILEGRLPRDEAAAILSRLPQEDERNPRSEAVRALRAMGAAVYPWEAAPDQLPAQAAIIIDGIAGTGLRGPLHGTAAAMAAAIVTARAAAMAEAKAGGGEPPLVVSVDIPSGLFDAWRPGMPLVEADATLGIAPLKQALYKPPARPFAGTILPVEGIFPPALIEKYAGPELIRAEEALTRIPRIRGDAHKYRRGLVEIRAGSLGSAGAARIAARGAQAAGAGLVRLVVDEALYPVLAASAGGIMVAPEGAESFRLKPERFKPDALLLGPGWGRAPDRFILLDRAVEQEARGTPLVLDADAIALARGKVFHGNALLTPHPGELAAFTALPKEEILADPGPILTALAREIRGTILFKGHVLYIAAEDGRLGILDGMRPALAAGGTGDLLAGFCTALAARTARSPNGFDDGFDGYTCAAAAASLLLAAAAQVGRRFIDPLELADTAAALAGEAWL